jgi:hypothetical protein
MDLKDLIVKSAILIKNDSIPLQLKYKLLSDDKMKLNGKYERLITPGKIYKIYKDLEGKRRVEQSHYEFFEDLEIRKGMITDHFINKYDKSLKKVFYFLF